MPEKRYGRPSTNETLNANVPSTILANSYGVIVSELRSVPSCNRNRVLGIEVSVFSQYTNLLYICDPGSFSIFAPQYMSAKAIFVPFGKLRSVKLS